ncbi:hypothetical protein AKJ42_03720 [candidate division MSBL1 archaeon SCGC-AAA261C02]|uniref:SpoVT-AbrB domain-containing protein n=1 Tax=candidate division MSBL1 archaeon SCGC-AAA261C02 TaxID=1698272 RepID=A0A133UY39_9EURY|nr:hypothetical protein AKJ42_03720 [candidate division MSBL1 archaeon SCGC-AAA261C02]
MVTVKMSRKGQLVVPKELREKLGMSPQDEFIAAGERDYIIFKRVNLPRLREEFEELSSMATRVAGERGITPRDIREEIEKERKGE